MDESHKHGAEGRKPDAKEYILWFCFYEVQGQEKLIYGDSATVVAYGRVGIARKGTQRNLLGGWKCFAFWQACCLHVYIHLLKIQHFAACAFYFNIKEREMTSHVTRLPKPWAVLPSYRCCQSTVLIQLLKQSQASGKPDTRVLYSGHLQHSPYSFSGENIGHGYVDEVPELFGSQAKFKYPPRGFLGCFVLFSCMIQYEHSWSQERTRLAGGISGHVLNPVT